MKYKIFVQTAITQWTSKSSFTNAEPEIEAAQRSGSLFSRFFIEGEGGLGNAKC